MREHGKQPIVNSMALHNVTALLEDQRSPFGGTQGELLVNCHRLWGTCKVTALGSSMGLQRERSLVESTGDPESGAMQESGGEQEVGLLAIPPAANQGNARTVKGLQGSTSTEELHRRGDCKECIARGECRGTCRKCRWTSYLSLPSMFTS